MNAYVVALLLGAVSPIVGCSATSEEIPTDPPLILATPPIVVTLSPRLDDGRLRVGASVQLLLTTNIPPSYTVTWVAADTTVFSVSSSGLAEGRKAGSSGLTVEVVYDSGRRKHSTGFEVVVFP